MKALHRMVQRSILSMVGVLASFAAACTSAIDEEAWQYRGSLEWFATQAQPVLAARCSNPSCHGNAARPLSIYAQHHFRLHAKETFLDSPLRAEELQHNLIQASIFTADPPDPTSALLLQKALAKSAGGIGHLHTEVFTDANDYDYQRLLTWLEQASAQEEVP
jgi:hypothetical protein